jgi:hypothetical protein
VHNFNKPSKQADTADPRYYSKYYNYDRFHIRKISLLVGELKFGAKLQNKKQFILQKKCAKTCVCRKKVVTLQPKVAKL